MCNGSRAVLNRAILDVHQFSRLSLDQKLSIKEAGRATPDMLIQPKVTAGKVSIRVHLAVLFTTKLRSFAGVLLKMLWFAILAYCSEETPLGHAMASETSSISLKKIAKQEKSIKHMSNTLDCTMVGNVNIAE